MIDKKVYRTSIVVYTPNPIEKMGDIIDADEKLQIYCSEFVCAEASDVAHFYDNTQWGLPPRPETFVLAHQGIATTFAWHDGHYTGSPYGIPSDVLVMTVVLYPPEDVGLPALAALHAVYYPQAQPIVVSCWARLLTRPMS